MKSVFKKLGIALWFTILASSAIALDTGPLDPASAANESSPTTSWTNLPDSLKTSDDKRSAYGGITSDSLYVTWADMSLDPSVTITALILSEEAQSDANQAPRRELTYIFTLDGTTPASGSDVITQSHDKNSDNTNTFSGDTDSTWGVAGLTGADFNTGTAGFIVYKDDGGASTNQLDDMTLTVHYTLAGFLGFRRRMIILAKE